MANTHFSKNADAIYNQHKVGSKPMPQTPANLKVEAASERAKRDYRELQVAKTEFIEGTNKYSKLANWETVKAPKDRKVIRTLSRKLRVASKRHETSDANYQKALSKAKLARSKQRNGLAYQLHVAKTKAEKERKPRNPRQPNPFK